ncbi:MAG: hypothetical protein M1434_12690 [Chloroflexi bacterium]|nr:hypothetical protein [Chloroflexota bacterium]MCL5275581.1 hypothetical protein [Chloroflexota bacterium]
MNNRFCERCQRSTQDGNLWCQDRDCPAEAGHAVFRYGDYLGDMKITRQISVWRTAGLYEADRNGHPVWVKIAHADPECEERIKSESAFLLQLSPYASSKKSFGQSLRPTPRPLLPQLMSPYPTPSSRPYGELSVAGVPRVFSVFAPLSGVILSEFLLDIPQIWHYEAAWMISSLSVALHPLLSRNLMHLSLTPQIILVDKDAEGHLRPALLDLGWLADANTTAARIAAIVNRSEPSYAAPEISAAKTATSLTAAADAYSLGIIYYEMLAGKPGYEPVLRHDDELRQEIIQNRAPLEMGRPELASAGVVQIVEKAISPRVRYGSIENLRQALDGVYGKPLPEKRPVPLRFYLLVGIIIFVLLAFVMFALLIAFQASQAPLK